MQARTPPQGTPTAPEALTSASKASIREGGVSGISTTSTLPTHVARDDLGPAHTRSHAIRLATLDAIQAPRRSHHHKMRLTTANAGSLPAICTSSSAPVQNRQVGHPRRHPGPAIWTYNAAHNRQCRFPTPLNLITMQVSNPAESHLKQTTKCHTI